MTMACQKQLYQRRLRRLDQIVHDKIQVDHTILVANRPVQGGRTIITLIVIRHDR
jgi:hypothetical protein